MATSPSNVSGKVALVTAAGQGLGRAIARSLHSRGYQLALLGRSDSVSGVAEETGAMAFRGDLTKAEDIKKFVSTAVGRFGRIDVVVNNTGHGAGGMLLEISDEQWDSGFDLLLKNVIRMSREVVPRMTDGGVIINISSFGAREPSASFPVSSVIRAGLTAFTRLFAKEYGNRNIRMINLLPGYFETYPINNTVTDSDFIT